MEDMSKIKVPEGWGEDEVTKFFGRAQQQAFASYINRREFLDKIIGIDTVYRKITTKPIDQGFWFPNVLLLKAHSAFLAAVYLAMNTQVTEAFCQMRSVLEYALYAFFVNKNPQLALIWAKREDSPEALQAVRDKFKIGPITKSLAEVDGKIGGVIRQLYERAISWGAHPNAYALFGVLEVKEGEDLTDLNVTYLSANPDLNQFCLRSVAQVGIGWLRVMRLVIPAHFSDEIESELQQIS